MHLDLPSDLVPEDYVLLGIDLDHLAVETLAAVPADPRTPGDDWLRAQLTPVLQVPSPIVPGSMSLLLNPAHPRAGAARIASTRPFDFDRRPWLPL